jgi:Myb/SANT-like DNA-binding domain
MDTNDPPIDPLLLEASKPAPKGKKKAPGLKASWTATDDTTLVDSLLTSKRNGLQSDSGFKETAYGAAAQALKGSEEISGGAAKTSDMVKNRWNQVCSHCIFTSTSITGSLVEKGL